MQPSTQPACASSPARTQCAEMPSGSSAGGVHAAAQAASRSSVPRNHGASGGSGAYSYSSDTPPAFVARTRSPRPSTSYSTFWSG